MKQITHNNALLIDIPLQAYGVILLPNHLRYFHHSWKDIPIPEGYTTIIKATEASEDDARGIVEEMYKTIDKDRGLVSIYLNYIDPLQPIESEKQSLHSLITSKGMDIQRTYILTKNNK